jgi:hypothetical protein
MEKIASAPGRYPAMGLAAAQSVADGFEQTKQIEALERCYAEAAGLVDFPGCPPITP